MESMRNHNLLNNIRVLLVEDDNFTKVELERFLKRRVGKLLTATSGMEGLDILQKNKVDIIITDLKMPNMNGLEMIKIAKKDGYEGPVIIISALSDSSTILKAVDIGIVKYIIKPIDTNQLIFTMEELSSNILKNKYNGLIINEDIILDRDKKVELEKDIGRKVAYFLKTYTGKGPKNIHVFLQGNEIIIKAEEILSIMETNIISDMKNYSIVDYNRTLFYNVNKNILESLIKEVINTEIDLVEVNSNSLKNLDILKFSFN